MFGFNTVSLDAKGRISMPARYRDAFKSKSLSKVVVTKDPQYPALKLYPGDEWSQISNKLQSLQGLDPCLLYTSPSPRDKRQSRMPSSA